MFSRWRLSRCCFGLLIFLCCVSGRAEVFDLLLTGGRIVDVTGNPWYRGYIGIRGTRIAEIGNLSRRTARRVISVHAQVVSPGFIDMMSAASAPLLQDRASAESK